MNGGHVISLGPLYVVIPGDTIALLAGELISFDSRLHLHPITSGHQIAVIAGQRVSFCFTTALVSILLEIRQPGLW